MTHATELPFLNPASGQARSAWPLALAVQSPRAPHDSGATDQAKAKSDLARATVEARQALEEVAAAAATAADRARSMAALLDDALAALADSAPGAAQPRASTVAPGVVLTPRERDVLALLAEGRSNKAIAEALFVSPNTVKTHVASLMHKLQAESRAHLAAIAARQALI